MPLPMLNYRVAELMQHHPPLNREINNVAEKLGEDISIHKHHLTEVHQTQQNDLKDQTRHNY